MTSTVGKEPPIVNVIGVDRGAIKIYVHVNIYTVKYQIFMSRNMSTNMDINSLKDENDKNKLRVYCMFCPSTILNAGAARFVNVEFKLPYVRRKRVGEADQQESITDYLLVEDMYAFENIGLSVTVDNIKYLVCADCEKGPIGWHDVATKKSYIALSRVKHE